ncbi:hypothetical protein BY996DRAFT_6618344 [Phakopsora pachyrhizi]|nr:hypothetical protein BY996DRAFT_6618344 [Phakopsora pachyrhizi]
MLENFRKEHEKVSKLKEETVEKLKALRNLKNKSQDDLFGLLSRKKYLSRSKSVAGSPLLTILPSISETKQTSYKFVTQGSKIKPRTELEELMRGFSTAELIRKHLSAELKKNKKMNIDEGIKNMQARKSAAVAGWLKMPLFGYAIANYLRRPLYYFSLDSMHTYSPTSSSYSCYPPFYVAFVNSNHNVVLHFKKFNGSIQPIYGY